ncbi:hypothetical protein J1N35_042031 [Gossypium stocksii]|uniref:Uncharacterized protein n=1 Tax=Gossypium stocksii TaxID=47602 RepID=A0A9D3ZJY4_9ROSI|nr:hypothetical protein J1N35_042031 [Gossypium stocksii]
MSLFCTILDSDTGLDTRSTIAQKVEMVYVLKMVYKNEMSKASILGQELEVNMSPPTLGCNKPELGTEALTQIVREVLEKVFEAKIRKMSETLQGRYEDCGKKRDHSPLR